MALFYILHAMPIERMIIEFTFVITSLSTYISKKWVHMAVSTAMKGGENIVIKIDAKWFTSMTRHLYTNILFLDYWLTVSLTLLSNFGCFTSTSFASVSYNLLGALTFSSSVGFLIVLPISSSSALSLVNLIVKSTSEVSDSELESPDFSL